MSPSPEVERRAAAELRASGRRLVGYVARYGVEARIGTFVETIAPGAFTRALASGADILALADHDPKAVLGRTKSGTLTLREDAEGLAFELALPETQAGRDLLALAERGDLGGMSFGFVVPEGGDHWSGNTRELRSVDLHEVSVVQSWPAYEQTSVAVRSRQSADHLALLRHWLETVR
ncbi:HK97 family phage prohead protease [Dyella sp. KRB-257]|uniref:HK97 family phage prohead protease n=1 Tax=Dyella sp. KRB-257 TaxID=3400915 RepID=UPI003C0C05C1